MLKEKIKELFNKYEVDPKEVFKEKFEDVQLVDETIITVEPEVAAGSAAVIMQDEQPVPIPVGEYELMDGRVLVIEEPGVILEVREPQTEEEEEVVEEMSNEDKTKEAKRVIESIVTEKVFEATKDLKEQVEKFKKNINELTDALSEEKKEKVAFRSEVKQLLDSIADEPKEEPITKKKEAFMKKKANNYFITKN